MDRRVKPGDGVVIDNGRLVAVPYSRFNVAGNRGESCLERARSAADDNDG
jgi:hypothetical protein